MKTPQQLASPPETGIAILLPELAVFHFIEIPPLHVPVNEQDVSPRRP